MAKKKSMLKLDRREATLGNQIQTRNEWHGEEGVPVKGIPLKFMIDRKELCVLLREPAAVDLLFLEKPGSAMVPMFQGVIEPVWKLLGKFENCHLVLVLGIDQTEVELSGVTIANVSIDRKTGGMTEVSCRADYHPTTDDDLRVLDHWLSREIKIELTLGQIAELIEKQPDLPMGDHAGKTNGDAPPIGTPEEERQRAHAREREIAQKIAADRAH